MSKIHAKPVRGLRIFPGYRWCGPGCSGPEAPINDVDACCMAHDECYRTSESKCRCDQAFLNCLQPKTNSFSRKGRQAAAMYNYMKLQQLFTCAGHRRTKRRN